MNKYQWKCNCCRKLKSKKTDIVSVGNICSDCVKKNNAMYKVLFSIYVDREQCLKGYEKHIYDLNESFIKTKESLIAENKAHKENMFKMLDEMEELRSKAYRNLFWGIVGTMSWIMVSIALFSRIKGWI